MTEEWWLVISHRLPSHLYVYVYRVLTTAPVLANVKVYRPESTAVVQPISMVLESMRPNGLCRLSSLAA